MKVVIAMLVIFMGSSVMAKKVKYRKTQEVNFDGVDVDGVARSPDAAFLAQRRGIKFMPMYKVRQRFDKSIKESVDYLR